MHNEKSNLAIWQFGNLAANRKNQVYNMLYYSYLAKFTT